MRLPPGIIGEVLDVLVGPFKLLDFFVKLILFTFINVLVFGLRGRDLLLVLLAAMSHRLHSQRGHDILRPTLDLDLTLAIVTEAHLRLPDLGRDGPSSYRQAHIFSLILECHMFDVGVG